MVYPDVINSVTTCERDEGEHIIHAFGSTIINREVAVLASCIYIVRIPNILSFTRRKNSKKKKK